MLSLARSGLVLRAVSRPTSSLRRADLQPSFAKNIGRPVAFDKSARRYYSKNCDAEEGETEAAAQEETHSRSTATQTAAQASSPHSSGSTTSRSVQASVPAGTRAEASAEATGDTARGAVTETTSSPLPPSASPSTPPSTSNASSTVSVSIWQRLGPVTRTFSAYGRKQQQRPLLTQFLSVLVIYLLGDISAQKIGGDEEYDPMHTARSLVVGGVASIPGYKWFMFLEGRFNYPSRVLSLVLKVVVNQVVFAPIFSCYFFGMHTVLAGGGLQDVVRRLQETVPVSVVNSLKLWPAVTAINFAYVPVQYRAIFAGSVAICWQTYLSWLNRTAEKIERETQLVQQLNGMEAEA